MTTQENYYIERKTRKHNYYGLAGTLLIHGIALLALIFFVISPPNPPMELEGMKMLLGETDMGGPDIAPVPEPSQTQETLVPIETQQDPPAITQETDEVNVTEKKAEKEHKHTELKPKHEPKIELPKKEPEPVVNSNALFKKGGKKGNQGGGYGSGDIPGNEGRYDGSPYGDPKETGKVVVRIVVDRDGNVVKATPGQMGSTTLNPSLLEKARQGAMQTHFSSREDGPDEQYGTMTISFRFKP
ncbi:MAG: hypothetical protein NTU43_12890 [Bacteroidetes bacterium]|nr:hypothetical protein [Bacteroidota bacterium]